MREDAETELQPEAPSGSSAAIDGGRFVPGTILDARYRIVALLGRGGMGEVYRAEDLKLGETVALKFLPESLGADGAALARFHREVRTARGIAHPNVVRVYDIGEQNGQPFLSMEYVDGEDLSVLLRRVGHLPHKKGVELARQLCAGLAAAHQAGVLHRDLKPANVMIDSEGRAKISDFGLSHLAAEAVPEDTSGTPLYMAPEQLADGRSSFASDIYSLGLVLYELFTGERPFRAASRQELMSQHQESAPAAPSSYVETLDPLIERAILQCLARDAESRPDSPLQLAAALPGGDPLAAALAAGETPSPEMVARATVPGTMSRRLAAALLATVLAGIVGILTLSDRQSTLQLDGLPLEPEVLAHKAATLLEDIGWREDSEGLGRFRLTDAVFRIAATPRSRREWVELASKRPPFVEYLYRAAPGGVSPTQRWAAAITQDDPPPTLPGMATVTLDSRGRLRELLAVPTSGSLANTDSGAPDWTPLFAAAELDPADWEAVEADLVPPIFGDTLAAWQGAYPGEEGQVTIDAAARGGRVVFWRIDDARDLEETPTASGNVGFALATFVVMLLIAGWQALRNARSGRGDRRGSLRIAVFSGLASLIVQISALLALSRGGALSLYLSILATALFVGSAVWLVYMAIEPLMRRHFPRGLVSWSRVLSGRFGDPLVGRDVLIGLTASAAWQTTAFLINDWRLGTEAGGNLIGGYPHGLNALAGPGLVFGNLFANIQIMLSLGLMFLYVIPRLILRNDRVASAVGGLAVIGFCLAFQGLSLSSLLAGVFMALLTARVGLLGLVAMAVFMNNLVLSPATLDTSAWWSYNSWIGIGAVVALAAWAFHNAAERPAPIEP